MLDRIGKILAEHRAHVMSDAATSLCIDSTDGRLCEFVELAIHVHADDHGEDTLQAIVDGICVMKGEDRSLPTVAITCTFVEHDVPLLVTVGNQGDALVINKRSEIDDITYTHHLGPQSRRMPPANVDH